MASLCTSRNARSTITVLCLMSVSFWMGTLVQFHSHPAIQLMAIINSAPPPPPPPSSNGNGNGGWTSSGKSAPSQFAKRNLIQTKPFNISDSAEIDAFIASQSDTLIMDIPRSESAQIYYYYFNMFCNGCDFGPIWSMVRSLCANDLDFSMFIVGANYGGSTSNVLTACAEVAHDGPSMVNPSIYAFEAIPDIFESFKEQFVGEGVVGCARWNAMNRNLRVFKNAVSDVNGTSVEVHSDLGGGGGLHQGFKPELMLSRGFVDTVNFDWVLHGVHNNEVVDYVLIDVEGFEVNVVRGMNLERNRSKFPMFQVELGGTWVDGRHSGNWTQGDLAEYLEHLGYDLFLLGGDKYWTEHKEASYGFDFRGCPKILRVYSTMFKNKALLRGDHGWCPIGLEYAQGNLLAVHFESVRPEIRQVMANVLREMQMEVFNHMKFVNFVQPGVPPGIYHEW